MPHAARVAEIFKKIFFSLPRPKKLSDDPLSSPLRKAAKH